MRELLSRVDSVEYFVCTLHPQILFYTAINDGNVPCCIGYRPTFVTVHCGRPVGRVSFNCMHVECQASRLLFIVRIANM